MEKGKNLISWYPFKENSIILEIRDDFILPKVSLLSSCELTIYEINKELNLKSFLNSFKDTKKFDYITLFGSLEKAISLFQKSEELFYLLKDILNKDGKILIVANNKFGISNWIGEENKIPHTNSLTKKDLDELFNKISFPYIKYYYPLPNYKETNVIYTDKILPNTESISRNLTLYKNEEIVTCNQNDVYQEILKNNPNDFPFFANSFFIELGLDSSYDNEICFVSFSNLRKEEFQVQTIIKKDKVYKKAVTDKAYKHINNMKKNIDLLNNIGICTLDTYDEEQIISNFVSKLSFDKQLVELLKENKKDECFNLIKKFRETLLKIPEGEKQNTIFEKYDVKIDENKKNKLHFLKYGLWDLIFQNCFLIDNDFYFYDQEWCDENVPIEFIIFRAISYLPNLTKYISKEDWMKQLEIYDFSDEFNNLDNKIQLKIRDENIWKEHNNLLLVKDLKENCKKLYNKQIERENYILSIEQDNKAKQEYITSLENLRNELMSQLEYEKNVVDKIVHSTSWKITEPIRKITGFFSKKGKIEK